MSDFNSSPQMYNRMYFLDFFDTFSNTLEDTTADTLSIARLLKSIITTVWIQHVNIKQKWISHFFSYAHWQMIRVIFPLDNEYEWAIGYLRKFMLL